MQRAVRPRRRKQANALAAMLACAFVTPLQAQVPSLADQEQARLRAEREAAERAARAAAPSVALASPASPTLGTFPVEQPCFPLRMIEVAGVDHGRLRWVPGFLGQYQGRCAGAEGLAYIVRSLQAALLDRGLVTTRAGLPEQDVSTGTLRVVVVPGVASAVRTNGADRGATWSAASPVDAGDLIDLRGLEQGLEQLRRVPGREVSVDLRPGAAPGDTVLDVLLKQRRPVSLSLSANNFAGRTVGRWQGAGQLTALGVLGLSELVSVSYNRRIDAPGIPADSRGTGAAVSVPFGWWTLGLSGSRNRYGQNVIGEVATFATRGRLDSAAAYVERVVLRDQISKTALRLTLGRRRARNFIDDIEIGIQRQDVTDVAIGLFDRRRVGAVALDSVIGLRAGTGLFGAQEEPDSRPAALPSARYRIFTFDLGVTVPLRAGRVESYRAEFRSQLSGKRLYGSDSLSVGGPYTVRGFDSDDAEIGKSGWLLRQELGLRAADWLRPYAFGDAGQVERGRVRAGLGGGLRAQVAGFFVDAFAGLPVTGRQAFENKRLRFGLMAGWTI